MDYYDIEMVRTIFRNKKGLEQNRFYGWTSILTTRGAEILETFLSPDVILKIKTHVP